MAFPNREIKVFLPDFMTGSSKIQELADFPFDNYNSKTKKKKRNVILEQHAGYFQSQFWMGMFALHENPRGRMTLRSLKYNSKMFYKIKRFGLHKVRIYQYLVQHTLLHPLRYMVCIPII